MLGKCVGPSSARIVVRLEVWTSELSGGANLQLLDYLYHTEFVSWYVDVFSIYVDVGLWHQFFSPSNHQQQNQNKKISPTWSSGKSCWNKLKTLMLYDATTTLLTHIYYLAIRSNGQFTHFKFQSFSNELLMVSGNHKRTNSLKHCSTTSDNDKTIFNKSLGVFNKIIINWNIGRVFSKILLIRSRDRITHSN